MKQIKAYLTDTRQELTKVSWPDRKKVVALVMVIFIIMVLVSVYVFVVDNILSFVVSALENIRL